MSHDRPLILTGTAAGLLVSAYDLVKEALERRQGRVTMIPSFSENSESPAFDVSSTPTILGDIAEAGLKQLGPSQRTLHPTHSWMVIGPRSEMHVVSGLYAMTPNGMGSPIIEVINMVGNAVIIGSDLSYLPSLYAAEESAGVPYVLRQAPVECHAIDSTGRSQSASMKLRSLTEPVRNWQILREFLLENDALQELPWGYVASIRTSYDRLVPKLRSSPEWLI